VSSDAHRRKPPEERVAELTPPWDRESASSSESADGPDEVSRFTPASMLAGRYRMIERIGRGGMGEVWQAEDLVLQTPVALKLIHSADEEGRERILKEVRLSRQITHPAVCRVFDVGEFGENVFFSMELVRGEDLATLIRRVGRLPAEKVMEIGLRLCAGMEAAHAQGVLHRDLKPANVLIDADGLVRITDFGIAISWSERRHDAVAGTPGYMAPEQVSPDTATPLSERTDVYALGVLLYELLTGQLPVRDPSGALIRPSRLVADVDPRLDRVITHALEPDPQRRPASAAALADEMRRTGPPHARPISGTWIAVAAVAVVALLAGLFYFESRGPALTDHDTIVLADFVNTTDEPVFDGALKVALAVALEQSPFLKVFSDERVRETLRLLERPADEPITRTVARDIARREQITALIAGSIGSFGRNYVLTLEAIHAETGDVMAREQVEVQEKEQVLRSLGDASSRLRGKLGESLASRERFDVSLPRATTASLDALHAYSQALDQGRVNPRREAIPHLKRALELDPEFAMAQALMSGVLANTGETAAAPEYSRRAFALRDRVSERERFFISWRYYIDAEQNWAGALELAESWTRTYPREAFAFNSLALASAVFGQRAEAAAALHEAIRLDREFVPPYGNLIGTLTAQGRFDEARDVLRDVKTRGIENNSIRRAAYVLAFLGGDGPAMAQALEQARRTPSAVWVPTWEARTAAFEGRFDTAHALYRRGVQSALAESLPELGAQWTLEDAELHALEGRCEEARRGRPLPRRRPNPGAFSRAGRPLSGCHDHATRAAADDRGGPRPAPGTARANPRAARAREPLRPRARHRALADVPARAGAARAEGRRRRPRLVPERHRPARRGPHLTAPCAGPSRPGARRGPFRRHGRGPQVVRRVLHRVEGCRRGASARHRGTP
jgi:eukaryotic-like serine/threonine-protein kinase